MQWIPLRVHSQYSILNSTLSLQEIVKIAQSFQIPSIALTDSGNLFGAVDFFKLCNSVAIKPILGCELSMAYHSRFDKKRQSGGIPFAYPIILLVKDQDGYRNLCELASIAYTEGFYYRPRIDKEVLSKYHKGLICLSGTLQGPISYLALHRDAQELEKEIQWYSEIFGEDFYFELQRNRMSDSEIAKDGMEKESWLLQKHRDFVEKQEKIIQLSLEFSKRYQIHCVATNSIHYRDRQDWKAHEVLLNVGSGNTCEIWEHDSQGKPLFRIPNPKRKTFYSHDFYFKSPQEMKEIFSDISHAIETTAMIADKCQFQLDFDKKHYPIFYPPFLKDQQIDNEQRKKIAEDYLYDLCKKAIEERYDEKQLKKVQEKYPDEDPLTVVQKRLDYEFEVVTAKEIADYFLIVSDFISWAKKRGIPVGPGRGSVAGSIIAYLLRITDIEPLQFHLFFERFINPERAAYPDIDVDICMERRHEVIHYTVQKYGKDRVAQIITFGTMKAKMAIKDVGRVLSVPLSKVNAIAKLIPDDLNITIEKALQLDAQLRQLYDADGEAKMILDMAQKIEGSIRNTSTHAAGIIISSEPLTHHIPVCVAKDTQLLVTQFAMKPVEAVGMLKIDFLGLKTLTSIQKAVCLIKHNRGEKIDWENLPLDDQKTYALLNEGKALGVFQMESTGMQILARQLHIDHFEEVIAVEALYRPGPMEMIPSFINRKYGREKIESDHPLMSDILKETYGVMVYQEQVMQIASKLAGYSLREGDLLRRAMGKKDRKEMARQREKFIQGAKEKEIDEQTAIRIFEKIEKFASYGFNKSHATAYAYLTYVTAYLKANFPYEWMAALMSSDYSDLSKVAKFIRECYAMDIPILPPDINEAGLEFVATKEGIRFAMSGIKGMGDGVVEKIVEERKINGPFQNLHDFICRIDTKKVGKKAIELLIDAGAFDFTQWSRDALRESLDGMYDRVGCDQREREKGVLNLFSILDDQNNKQFLYPPTVKNASSEENILRKEYELLGFYLTGNPLDTYRSVLQKVSFTPLRYIEQFDGKRTVLCSAFILEEIKYRISSKNQRKFAILTISDGMIRFELPIWPEMYEKKNALLEENRLFLVILEIERDQDQLRLQCRFLEELAKIDDEMIRSCNSLYEQLSHQSLNGFRKKVAAKMEKKTLVDRDRLEVWIDADQAKLTQILNIKKIFAQYPGHASVSVCFFNNQKKIGTLFVDSKWNVQATHEQLKKKLLQIPCIQNFCIMQDKSLP